MRPSQSTNLFRSKTEAGPGASGAVQGSKPPSIDHIQAIAVPVNTKFSLPTDGADDMVEFEIDIQANMADLLNEGINEIEIVTTPDSDFSTSPGIQSNRLGGANSGARPSFASKQKALPGAMSLAQTQGTPSTPLAKNFDSLIAAYRNSPSNSQSVMTIDPKESLSHGDLSNIGPALINKSSINMASAIAPKPFNPSGNTAAAAPHIDLFTGGAAVEVGSLNKIQDNFVESVVNFSERPITDVKGDKSVSINDIIDNHINFDKGAEPLINSREIFEPLLSPYKNLNTSRPVIENRSENIVKKVTTKKLKIKVPRGTIPEVKLKNTTGRYAGTVTNNAKHVNPEKAPVLPQYYNYFSKLGLSRKMFNISISTEHGRNMLHISSPHKFISGYTVMARTLTKSPDLDLVYNLGSIPRNYAQNYSLNNLQLDLNKRIMFHVIPEIQNKPICHSHTFINEGIEDEYSVSPVAIQYSSDLIRFHIRNIPIDAINIYAVRTNELSGDQINIPMQSLNLGGKSRKFSDKKEPRGRVFEYIDGVISDINSIYSYDFFVQNRYGIEKHLFRKTVRTYEKNNTTHVFNSASLKTGNNNSVVARLNLKYPNPFVPRDRSYSMTNPDDDFFEACRNLKRVCILKIIRHSARGDIEQLGTYVLNPGELNTLEAEIDKVGNFKLEIEFNSEFFRNAGITPNMNPSLDYYYEFRMGSYLLSNELSFLDQPLKLDVPNEFTDGKIGYSYHPYVYDTPVRKDYGLHGIIGTSKKYLYEESLTSEAKIILHSSDLDMKVQKFKTDLRAKMQILNSGNYCVVLEADLSEELVSMSDHFELLVGDSTTGSYRSLGKNKLINSAFYYVDTTSTELACNKLKYKLIARSIGLENIVELESRLVDISSSNTIKRKEDRASLGAMELYKIDRFKGRG